MDARADDLSWLLFCAVRYSLGRMSYAPSLTAEIVLRYRWALTPQQTRDLASEIREHLERWPATSSTAGFRIEDDGTWKALASELEKP